MARYVLGDVGARKLRELLNGRGVSESVPGSGSGLAIEDAFVDPFAVKWAQSVGDSGSWIIWLPGTEIVVADGEAIDPTTDLDEAEGDYPEGWYILDEDVLDPDEGGTLYLNITHGEDVDASCEFSDTAGSGDNVTAVAVCEASVDATTGARSIKQFVTSAVVIASGSGGDDTLYYADEYSVSQKDSSGTNEHIFTLKGFGRFTSSVIGPTTDTFGTFTPSSELTLSEDEPSTVAVVCRAGNSDTVDLNQVCYRTLKLGLTDIKSPFKYTKAEEEDEETGETVTTHKLTNCTFYWQGELQALADFDVSAIINNGTAYLCGTQTAPSASDPDPTWVWAVDTEVATAPSGGKVLNYKLYDFANGKPSLDYRTTFLSLEDHTTKAKLEVKKPTGDELIYLDTTGTAPEVKITDGVKSISLNLGDIPSDCGGELKIHKLEKKDKYGNTQTYHGLFCEDIDLKQDGKLIKDVTSTATSTSTTVKFTYTDDTFTEFTILNGTDGEGTPGQDGNTPEITAERIATGKTAIYADGEQIAVINDGADGNTPVITMGSGTGTPKTYPIYSNGVQIGSVRDGADGTITDATTEQSFITDISFGISGGKLKAYVKKKKFKAIALGAEESSTVDVATIVSQNVVASSEYTGSYTFVNHLKTVGVLSSADANPSTSQVFSTVAHSSL